MAYMSVPSPPVMNFGFKYWQDVEVFVALLIWPLEDGRFLSLVK